jgi:hypothetical protein
VGAQFVTSSTTFSLYSDTPPVLGSQVCWLSNDDWVLRTANVTAPVPAAGPSGTLYAITIDTPFVSNNGVVIANGDIVFPNAVNMATYIAAILNGFAGLGPGQKTNSPGLLPRAFRRPLVGISWPSDLNYQFLRNLTDSGEEVSFASYLYQNGFPSNTTPPLPSSITQGPYILVPQQIGVFPA